VSEPARPIENCQLKIANLQSFHPTKRPRTRTILRAALAIIESDDDLPATPNGNRPARQSTLLRHCKQIYSAACNGDKTAEADLRALIKSKRKAKVNRRWRAKHRKSRGPKVSRLKPRVLSDAGVPTRDARRETQDPLPK
jgi:hypothetical protein